MTLYIAVGLPGSGKSTYSKNFIKDKAIEYLSSDEELLKKLQKDVGAPAGSQHGKPSMAKPNDDTEILDAP